MKLETQAILHVAKIVGSAMVGSAVMMLVLTYIPINYIAIGLVVVGFGLMLLTLYSMEVDRLRILEKTREILKK
jgi:hypothetical protein